MICEHVFEWLAREVAHAVNTIKNLIINIIYQQFLP